MTAMKKKKIALGRWLEAKNGHEYNNDPQFLLQTFAKIKEEHKYVFLLHEKYQSGNTLLVSVTPQSVDIDCPVDWPGSSEKIRVLFRDDSNVWNYFNTKVISRSKDTLKTAFPTELFRMQRRAYFRVQMSSDYKVSFSREDGDCVNLSINNLSVGGMLVCLPNGADTRKFNDAELLTDISIAYDSGRTAAYDSDNAEENSCIDISQGFVARTLELENGQKCIGVKFNLQGAEENEIMEFVRRNELASLRKGV